MISTWREGWKVTHDDFIEGRPMSATAEGVTVEYKLGFVTTRPRHHGPLSVFVDEASAFKFVTLLEQVNGRKVSQFFRIWKCLYAPSVERTMWYVFEYPLKRKYADTIPSGTDFADVVVLTSLRSERAEPAKFGTPRWIQALQQ